MRLTGNTVLITGGGSGIGRGLAEAFHRRGNKVIISGRRAAKLQEVTEANPGMQSVELDVDDPQSIASVAGRLIAEYPELNVVINNSGIMKADDVGKAMDDEVLVSTVTTNLLGPIRVSSALVEHLKQQESAAVVYVTSGLAFTPLALNAVYSATKAAVHSYALSQRYRLKNTSVQVIELIPPYVRTELQGERQKNDLAAMPLSDFIAESMRMLGTDADELPVQMAEKLRNNAGTNEREFIYQMNAMREKERS